MLGDKLVPMVTGNRMSLLKFLKMTQFGSFLDPKYSSVRKHFYEIFPGTKFEISIKSKFSKMKIKDFEIIRRSTVSS